MKKKMGTKKSYKPKKTITFYAEVNNGPLLVGRQLYRQIELYRLNYSHLNFCFHSRFWKTIVELLVLARFPVA